MLSLLRYAKETANYDRYCFLQGLDYPIKSKDYILNFFTAYKDVEFIRGCNATKSNTYYFRDKCRSYYFYDTDLKLFKLWNYTTRFLIKSLHMNLRKGYVREDGKRYDVYWGAAQFAITGNCADYILDFERKHPLFNRYFRHVYPADETYFASIVMNSRFASRTWCKGSDLNTEGLVMHRNLHYFEYDGGIRIFTADDLDMLLNREELYCRKVNSKSSLQLLDALDEMEERGTLNGKNK